jgi:hypothetical protein
VESAPDDAYAELLQTIESARSTIEKLEATPPSAKRDHMLELLRERLGRAIRRLDQIQSETHSN